MAGRTKYSPVDREKLDWAFILLKEHYGSHIKAAVALGLSPRTYVDWRMRGVPGLLEETLIIERASRISEQKVVNE